MYVITEPCVGVKDASCVAVCPVDCIVSSDADDMYFIDPAICIDCGACMPECPVDAILVQAEMAPAQEAWVAVNADYVTMPREGWTEQHGALVAAAKAANAGSPHANPALYAR